MKFCSACGAEGHYTIPEGDNRERFVCLSCEIIHYQNPRVVTGCLPIWQDQVLLCLRAIEPRKGYWTLPAGFLENRETIVHGAARETAEEANARVSDLQLYTVFSLPHISQIYMFYRAELLDGSFAVGEESTEVALFSESDIPWQELAFPVIEKTLELFFKDRSGKDFPVHSHDLIFKRGHRL